MLTSVVLIAGTWPFLVPKAYLLGVHLEMGANGIWIGMTSEVFVISLMLGWRAHHLLDGKVVPPSAVPRAAATLGASGL